jgi:ribosome biogenesis protein Tsr3
LEEFGSPAYILGEANKSSDVGLDAFNWATTFIDFFDVYTGSKII